MTKHIHVHFHRTSDKLLPGGSRETISKNIATEVRAGKDPKQAAAIAYSKARGDAASPEQVSEAKQEYKRLKDLIEIVKKDTTGPLRLSSLQEQMRRLRFQFGAMIAMDAGCGCDSCEGKAGGPFTDLATAIQDAKSWGVVGDIVVRKSSDGIRWRKK